MKNLLPNEKPALLIVDDNKKYVVRLISLLEEAGHASPIITAENYDEAISLIAKKKPGIVLLDINMPGKTGMEVLRYIKREDWECKVVMVTNHSNESYHKLCLDAGANYFLDKTRDFGLIPSLVEKMSK